MERHQRRVFNRGLGSGDVGRGAPPPPTSSQRRAGHLVSSPLPAHGSSLCGHVAHDDSALYRRSKGSQQSAMRHWRPRRGESFSAGKSQARRSAAAGDPAWHRTPPPSTSTPHHPAASSTTTSTTSAFSAAPPASVPSLARADHAADFSTVQPPASDRHRHQDWQPTPRDTDGSRVGHQAPPDKDPHHHFHHQQRLWSHAWGSGGEQPEHRERDTRHGPRELTQDKSRVHGTPRPMVSSRSSPNLNNQAAETGVSGVAWGSLEEPQKPVSKSSSSIPGDLQRGSGNRAPDRQVGEGRPAPRLTESARDRTEEVGPLSHRHHPRQGPGKHDPAQRQAPGMDVSREAQCAVSHAVVNYSPGHHPVPYKVIETPVPNCQPSSSQAVPSYPSGASPQTVPNYRPGHHHAVPNYRPDSQSVPTPPSDQRRGRDPWSATVSSPMSSSSFQPYENVTLVASASLKSSKGWGEEEVVVGQRGDGPTPPPRPHRGVRDWKDVGGPAPSAPDPSGRKSKTVSQNHEKSPPWPLSSAGPLRDPTVPMDTRVHSGTDQFNAQKEMCPQLTPAGPSSARPLMEKNPEGKGRGYMSNELKNVDATAKTPMAERDPPGTGAARNAQDIMKARLEDFGLGSIPGYLPPRVDAGGGGGRLEEKDYKASAVPERDVDGVGRQILLQRFSPGTTSSPQPAQPHPHRTLPASLPAPSPHGDSSRVDKSTSPLASPLALLPSPTTDSPSASRSPSPKDRVHRDVAAAATKQTNIPSVAVSKAATKAVIVRSTPYYNTSTQTELSAYALKTSDSRGVPQCNVQIQVEEADRQTTPRKMVEEKSIQARMSREFHSLDLDVPRRSPESQPSSLDLTGVRKPRPEEKSYFQFPFEGRKALQEKYGMDEETAGPFPKNSVFSCMERSDQASIMRQLSEELYRGSRLGGTGDKPHLPGSHLEPAFASADSGSVPVSPRSLHEASSAGVKHPSPRARPYTRQLSASQTSVADSRHDLSPASRAAPRSTGPGGQSGQDYFPGSSPRPLQESKKFKSLSAISHNRESSMPAMAASLAQSHESLSPDAMSASARRSPSESGRDSGSVSKSPSPTPPHTPVDSHGQAKVGAFHSSSGLYSTASSSRHSRTQSVDSLLSDRPAGCHRERASGAVVNSSADQNAVNKVNAEMVGRKPSMKKAYGIYDDYFLGSPREAKAGAYTTDKEKGGSSDSAHLGQIREEDHSAFTRGPRNQRPGDSARHKTQGDITDQPHSLDSWRDDLDKRTGRFQNRASSELILSPRDRSAKVSESFTSPRPPRLFDGSIDSGVGSEISCRVDGLVTPSETPRSPLLPLDSPTGAELKQIQQQAVLNFLQRKTGRTFQSPEPSVYESMMSPRVPEPKSSDPVADLISKTNATLAKRADSLRRTSSICSRSSSVEHVEVNRSRKETEWSRLRSSGSFNYGSNRSSLCSDNTYEDISVFAPSTPRGSVLETSKTVEGPITETKSVAGQDGIQHQRSNTDSGVMASTTAYQNIPGPPPRRRPPPPPPRSPSPEPGPPPALPPRSYGPRKEEGGGAPKPSDPGEGEVKVDESKVDFKSVLQQCRDQLNPRDDAYTAQLRKLDVKFSGLRGSSTTSTTPPTSMSVLHSRTPMGISTSYKRQPTVAQEATPPVTSATSSISFTPSVSSTSSLGARASSPHNFLESSSSVESHVSIFLLSTSQTKESSGEPSMKGVVDRDTKPVPASSAKPPQLPERAVLPPREHKPSPGGLPPRSEGPFPKDTGVSDFHTKVSEWQFMPPPEVSRDRKLIDSHAHQGKTDSGSASPLKDSSRSPAGKRREVPPPPLPSKDEYDGVGAGDSSHLPLPPPELLSDGGGHPAMQEKPDSFADDSYGAYRNRGSRQVGTYKRSSSAALLRPDNQHLKGATDAQAVFGDRRLGNQAWNSDTQLQANRKVEVQGASSNVSSGVPQRPPDRAGNIPAEGVPARSVGRVSGISQASMSSAPGQTAGRSRDDGKVFTAHPFRVEQAPAVMEKEAVNSHDSVPSSRLVGTEKGASPSLSPTPSPLNISITSSSSGQRWANAMPFTSTHRVAGDDIKPLPGNAIPGSPHSHSVSHSRPAVLTATDTPQPKDRPLGSSPIGSTHYTTRSRLLSDRTRHGGMSPSADSKQRFAEVAPFASDPRSLPGHVRTYSQSSDPSRSTASPYSRRESAPVSHIPPEAIAMVPPRRKSEDQLLSDTEKETSSPTEQVLISHGRQPSQEELECDQRAKELAKEVADSEKKLSDVLNSDASKKRMEYINGIFCEPVEVKIQASVRMHHSQSAGDVPSTKPPLLRSSLSADEDQLKKRTSASLKPWVSSPEAAAKMETKEEESTSESVNDALDGDSLVRHKEEVMEKLHKKLELLKEEKKGLQEEIDSNKALGKQVCDTVDSKCSNPSERDKFHTYVNDVEKIVRLLLNLSGQLARAESAAQVMEDSGDSEQKKRAQEKCEGLRTKYAEAKQLKEHIDKRSDNVSAILRQSLSSEELKDYSQFISSTSRLTIHLQQLDDEIALNQQQIQELKKSIADWATAQQSSASSPYVSSPVPVSS